MTDRIPVAGPWITQKEIDYVTDAVTRCWYDDANLYHQRFESAFAAHCGRKYAMALPSCTSALHLSLLGLGIESGDEVVVPESTWIATSAPIDYVGARPAFADVDPESWCLSAAALEQAITPRTKAAIVVDLYGNMPDWDALNAVAQKHRIALIEDSAEAVGSLYRQRPAGSFGISSCFSLHGSKTLTAGEGGVLLTDDDAFFARCQTLRDHGRRPGDVAFYNNEVAHKYKMSSMQAALGLAQLERLPELIDKKRRIFHWYVECAADTGLDRYVTLNQQASGVLNTYWMITALLNPDLGLSKEPVMEALRAQGVDTRPFFYPLSHLPAYRHRPEAAGCETKNPASYDLGRRGLNLPSALSLTHEQVRTVCRTFAGLLKNGSLTAA